MYALATISKQNNLDRNRSHTTQLFTQLRLLQRYWKCDCIVEVCVSSHNLRQETVLLGSIICILLIKKKDQNEQK